MNKVLLDTDILSEIFKKKNEKVIKAATKYLLIHEQYTFSTITIMEIVKGLHKVGKKQKMEKFLSILSDCNVLALDIESAKLAGKIYADLESSGQPIGRADPMIAAIAITNDLTLCTGNLKHYNRIKNLEYDLKLENWKD